MPRDANRPRLGRGLSSLIRNSALGDADMPKDSPDGQYVPADTSQIGPTQPVAHVGTAARHEIVGGAITMIPIRDIRPNPYQPRRQFDTEGLNGLAQSIRSHGLLQPVLVTRLQEAQDDQHFTLLAGERRLRAAELAGVTEIPCIIRRSSSQEMLEAAIIENIHRSDLNPIERANAYRQLMDAFSLTQQQVADRVGEPRASVANYLRLLDLCDDVQNRLLEGKLSFGHAKVLAGLAGAHEVQSSLAEKAIRENLSVRRLEELVKAASEGDVYLGGARQQAGPPAPAKLKPPYIADLERQLSQAVGTRVSIRPGRGKHSGRVVIEYYGLEDFDRIVSALGATIDS